MGENSKRKLSDISLRDLIYGIFGTALGGGILWILSTLWDLQRRVSGLETRVDDLTQIVLKKVVTETITVTTTGTYYYPNFPPAVPGYPFESIVMGLLIGLLVVLLIHRSRRYWRSV